MSDDTWNEGWSEDEEEDESRQEGLFAGIRRWLTGEPKSAEEDSETALDDAVEAARQRVEEYRSSGKDSEHRLRMEDSSYRASAEYRIANETEHLERHLAHYDEACTRSGADAMLSQDMWAQRIAGLNQALDEQERSLTKLEDSYETLEDRWQRGTISRAEYDDLHRKLGKKEQRDGTRLELAGLGGGFSEIGDVADQVGHIFEDGLSDDNGEIRQKISRKLREMPRRMALAVLKQALDDGKIGIETARYLEREYVRPS